MAAMRMAALVMAVLAKRRYWSRLTPAAPIVGWWPARHAGLLDQYSVAMAMHMPTAANDGNALKAGHVER
jgi:hypothetical protein